MPLASPYLRLYNVKLEKEVLGMLKDGNSENEVLSLLKIEGKSEEDIVKAMANVSNESSVVHSYCEKVIVPEIKQLLEIGCTVGEVLETLKTTNNSLYKKKILVDYALCMILSDLYLVD